jgi:hypothetical protein
LIPFHVEHIVPRKHGGGDDLQNLCLACPDCNFRKGSDLTSIDPETGAVTRLFDPRTQDWNQHFGRHRKDDHNSARPEFAGATEIADGHKLMATAPLTRSPPENSSDARREAEVTVFS